MRDIIINFTPTGVIPRKEDTPHVPLHPKDIINQVQEAYELGITMVHLHARDIDGNPSSDKDIYKEIIMGIRAFAKDLIICVSTTGRLVTDPKIRASVLELDGEAKPDMASLTLSSLNFNHRASINAPDTIKYLANTMNEKGIKPELEIFDLGMVNYMNYLIKKDILKPPYYVNVILNNIACAQANFLELGTILNGINDDAIVSLGAIGKHQLRMNSTAIANGLGVRVGIEDNYWFDNERTILATNSNLIKRIHKIIDGNDAKVMTPSKLRTLLNLKPGYGEYGIQ